ncbi:SCO7613 C-terminal domain-containing membrane protein [Streptomyces sp. WAC05950]|uniref:SCO7613 C-terminal domain-containing membrane protein n=1 Tax=Streptomyces sp. WAC05950 TaxID=2487419 RepID=UPI0011E4D240|nr:hypothetical protein [Streptomyces sp. WAC05950]
MNSPLPPAEELALVDRELAQLDARRLYLLARRDWLLRLVQQSGAAVVQWGPAASGSPAWTAGPSGPAKEASAPSAQNVLLTLGAVLLAVAALAFTLVSWGSMGIAGRSAVLAVVTAAALAAPAVLLRRGLRSTAESVAAVGLLLTVLDAYALYAVGMPDADGTGYAAGAAAVLAAVWAGYGSALRTLRIPLPALDAALALRVRAAALPAALLGSAALLVGAAQSWSAGSAAQALGPAALLLAGAALGAAAAWREPRVWGAALVGGVAAVVGALGALASGAAVAPVLVARLRVLEEVWAATTPAADPYGPGASAAVGLLLTAGAAWWLSRVSARPEPGVLAVVLGWSGLFTAPVLLGFPVAVVFAVQLAVTGAVGFLALRRSGRGAGIAAAACALAGAVNVSLGALDGRAATFAVWGLLGAGCAAGAAYGPAARWVRSAAAVCAVGYATGLLVASAAVTDLAVVWWALPVLAVAAVVAALGPRLGAVRLPAEIAAAVAGVLALALSAGRPGTLALTLALSGVVCAGAAVRPERRVLGWAAGALFVAATWVRLAEAGVTAPEAYTLPVTVPALAVGFLRRRRDARASSWTAYGPGLAATLLPSLVAAWADADWVRPLVLGVAALAVTLAGARWRLQAPLLLGGAVLAAVAVHELAPYVVQVAGALPRWVLPALAGVLLLAVGATYEKRLRDARRLRAAIGRLG